jgi:hypothetical protein
MAEIMRDELQHDRKYLEHEKFLPGGTSDENAKETVTNPTDDLTRNNDSSGARCTKRILHADSAANAISTRF